jgi:cell envelope opacity-associated protein A
MAPVKKKKAVVQKVAKKASASKPKAVIKSKPKPKTVVKKVAPVKTSTVKGEVSPKILTGEGLRRKLVAAIKNKK